MNSFFTFFRIGLILMVSFLGLSCSGPDSDEPEDNTPSNLNITITRQGESATFPNGDGSGVINMIITADNATLYKVLINSDLIESTTGLVSYTFNEMGTHSYTIHVSAYNGSQFISDSRTISVYVVPGLVWSDEFNTDGAPNPNKWGYNTGTGTTGWGNNELQYYTNRPENVIVEGGLLKIKLIKENYMGSAYTSARLLSQGKYDFKYGKIEFRAKLPAGGGTWPALWMLGANIGTASWPACGEIDVMEHVGNQLNKIYGSLHHPGHSGANPDGATLMINNATTEFHIYTTEWNSSSIKFYVDNQLYYTFTNNSTLPFNQNFFIIMNCAMGGNFGGTVDPNFTSATFEIDYVRVYQ